MGSPKALLPYRGETFADCLIQAFAACDDTIVVLGHDAERIRQGIARPATFVLNPHPENGQLSSLKCGLRAVEDAEIILFTPVDYPAIQASTVERLLQLPDAFAMPRHWGRRGHPIRIGKELRAQLLACSTTARDVIRAHDPAYIDVDDPGILEDIDDPVAYARLTQEFAAR